MRPRLKDVAERAGVSIKTVSNVVNDRPYVRPDMRARVEKAIAELGYRPNVHARSLRGGSTGVIALAVPELDIPYFAELAKHVITAADEYSWTVLVDHTGGEPERERIIAAGVRDHLIDGLIFSPLALTAQEIAEGARQRPLVLLGEREHGGTADRVAIDNVAAAAEATAHLIGLGRRRVAAIGSRRSASAATARLRLRGYRQALADAGRKADPRLIASAGRWHRAEGARAMARLLDSPEPPDAVFCFNDLLALGALHELARRGIRVPETVAVVGVDDIEDGRYANPTLTTIAPDKGQIARLAVRLLHERLRGEPAPPRELVADHRLVVRESTAGRPASEPR